MHLVQTAQVMSESEFGEELQKKLDLMTIDQLNVEVTGCLSDLNPQHFGWEIAGSLRGELRSLWQDWHDALRAAPEHLKRFLLLMVVSEDSQQLQNDLRLQVGSLSVITAILR